MYVALPKQCFSLSSRLNKIVHRKHETKFAATKMDFFHPNSCSVFCQNSFHGKQTKSVTFRPWQKLLEKREYENKVYVDRFHKDLKGRTKNKISKFPCSDTDLEASSSELFIRHTSAVYQFYKFRLFKKLFS